MRHHLLENEDVPHLECFTGRDLDSELVCKACVESPPALREVCAACRATAAEGSWIGIFGAPEIAEKASPLRFEHQRVELARCRWHSSTQPVLGPDRNC